MLHLGIIGKPLVHSYSKQMFNDKFKSENIDGKYEEFEIDDISQIVDIIDSNLDLLGFNVTIPYKQKIIPYLNELSPEAKKVGAVNCVKIIRLKNNSYKLLGYNTDIIGFKESLLDFVPPKVIQKANKRALILGTGGASMAVEYVLSDLGFDLKKVSRNPQGLSEIAYKDISPILGTCQIIVNATPLGTFPNVDSFPDLPYSDLNSNYYLFDLVYNPSTTKFMQLGKSNNAHVLNGSHMLNSQALAACEIWGI